jgi:predicted glutamine amidotransferase
MDKHLRITIIVAILMVSLSASYYFVIYLPGLEKQKKEQTEREKEQTEREKEQTEREHKIARLRESIIKREQYSTCLRYARKNYETEWAETCEKVAVISTEALSACLARVKYNSPEENYCRKNHPTTSPSPDCSLPKSKADELNQKHKQAQDKCIAEANAGL